MRSVLAINSGSSSLRFALFKLAESHSQILLGKFDRIGLPDAKLRVLSDGRHWVSSACLPLPYGQWLRVAERATVANRSLMGLRFAVLSPKIIASCEDFFNAEAAKDRAEERGGDFFCGLCENLCGLCVEGALLGCLVAASPLCVLCVLCGKRKSVVIRVHPWLEFFPFSGLGDFCRPYRAWVVLLTRTQGVAR